MHIVIDAHLAEREIDGVTRYLNGLLSELPGLDAGIDYTILTLPRQDSGLPDEIFDFSNVRRRQLDLYGPSPKQHLIMRQLLKELKADLYHHPQYDLPLGIPIPTVATIHDLKFLLYPEFLRGKNAIKSLYIRQSLKQTIRAADQIIAVSRNTLKDLQNFFNIDERKVTVIHHGIDTRHKQPQNIVPKPANLPDDFVLFVGTRRPHKNIEGLIRAIKILRAEREVDIDLVVCGKAYPDYDEPEKLAGTLDLEEHIHFLDFVEDEVLSSLYQEARVVALTSFYEGFGFPLIEAMSYGTPVVGANVSSIPEVVGKAGLLADPQNPHDIADKIQSIVEDHEIYQNLSAAGLKRSKRFTWNSVAKATLNVYNKALSGKRFSSS